MILYTSLYLVQLRETVKTEIKYFSVSSGQCYRKTKIKSPLQRQLELPCCAVKIWEGQFWRTHCDSPQGLSPRSSWMTRLPKYLAGREVFGVGSGGAPQGGLDVTEITREHEARVSLQPDLLWLWRQKCSDPGPFLMWWWSACVSRKRRLPSVMLL